MNQRSARMCTLTGLAILVAVPSVCLSADRVLRVCRLANLQQIDRERDEIGLAVGTTSWNPGGPAFDWYRRPDARHPFIAQALYRLSGGRLEQIGVSGIKHGYFVASAQGCDGTPCNSPPGHTLSENCTDTYGALLNAGQNDMGPRYEINPWTGNWNAATSHVSTSHTHGTLTHMLRVLDNDLQDTVPGGTEFIVEAYYVHYQNPDALTAAAWAPASVRGAAGGVWSFEVDGVNIPTSGFAISAWSGATVQEFATRLPAVKGISADGRGLIAAKVTPIDGGRYRYEYAVLNVDMDRRLRSFRVPVPAGVRISDAYFHAPRMPDEREGKIDGIPISDKPWAMVSERGSLYWSSRGNSIPWGVMFNFGFTADRAAAQGAVAMEFAKVGGPASVEAKVQVPSGAQ